MTLTLAKPGDVVISEVGWRLHKRITLAEYERDMRYAADLSFPVYEWRGEDRDHRPMVISWVTTGVGGSLLSAYEIQGRA